MEMERRERHGSTGGVTDSDVRSPVHGGGSEEERCRIVGYWPGKRWKQARAIFDLNGICPTLTAAMGGKHVNNFVWVDLTTCGKEREE